MVFQDKLKVNIPITFGQEFRPLCLKPINRLEMIESATFISFGS